MRTLFCVLAFATSVTFAANSAPLKVVMVSGSWEYGSDASLEFFHDYIEDNYDIDATILKAESRDNLPGLEALDNCDVALFFTRRLELPDEQLQHIKDYALSGRPIVAVRTASHGFQTWLEFDGEVLGGNYDNHYGHGPDIEISIREEAKDHPILTGVEPFQSSNTLYKTAPLAKDCNELLRGDTSKAEKSQPLAWTRLYKGARIFYIALGNTEDFENDNFLRILVNALFWTAERPVPEAPKETTAEGAPL